MRQAQVDALHSQLGGVGGAMAAAEARHRADLAALRTRYGADMAALMSRLDAAFPITASPTPPPPTPAPCPNSTVTNCTGCIGGTAGVCKDSSDNVCYPFVGAGCPGGANVAACCANSTSSNLSWAQR